MLHLAISRDWRRLETNALKCFVPGVALSCATWMPCHFQLENWWTLISIKTRGNQPTAIFQRILLPAAGARTGVTGAPNPLSTSTDAPTRSSRSISGSPLVLARHLIAWSSAPCFPVGAEVGWCCGCQRGSVIRCKGINRCVPKFHRRSRISSLHDSVPASTRVRDQGGPQLDQRSHFPSSHTSQRI
jgi:hypothetical protein